MSASSKISVICCRDTVGSGIIRQFLAHDHPIGHMIAHTTDLNLVEQRGGYVIFLPPEGSAKLTSLYAKVRALCWYTKTTLKVGLKKPMSAS